MRILYSTKAWAGDVDKVFTYHPKPDLVVGNNLGFRFVDMGATSQPYYEPELRAVTEAHWMGASHILWYASDVKPPEGDWLTPALELLKDYPIVSPFWTEDFESYALYCVQRGSQGGFKATDFGFEDHFFSDHAYLAEVQTMLDIDYHTDHPIKSHYPAHGGNSFECRVAQWLATTGQKRAVLKDFKYRHTTGDEK